MLDERKDPRRSEFRKTVIFERKYGVDIRDFTTSEQIDRFMENKLGKVLGSGEKKGKIVPNPVKVSDTKLFNIRKMLNKALLR